jgi:hypothetical protein
MNIWGETRKHEKVEEEREDVKSSGPEKTHHSHYGTFRLSEEVGFPPRKKTSPLQKKVSSS